MDKRKIKKAWKQFLAPTTTEILLEENPQKKTGEQLCRLCQQPLYVMEDYFPTCVNVNCGHMETSILDDSPEWNSFGKEDGNDMTRCGNPENPLLKESSAACKVLKTTKCSFEMRKIDKWIEWQAFPHKEKTLYDEFQYITNMGRIAGVSTKIIDTALIKHKEISDEQMFRGLNRDGIKAASIYLAYRINGYPRTASEIAKMFVLDKKHATKGCAVAVNILNNIERNSAEQTELCKITTGSIIERYCAKFENITDELCLLAKFIAFKIEKEQLILDNTPQAVASGIIYFINQIAKLGITKQEIIRQCEISDVTVNKCFKKINAHKEVLLPSQWLNRIE